MQPSIDADRSVAWRRLGLVLMLMVMAFVLASCAAGGNPGVGVEGPEGGPAGFWLGLWHGIIAPIAFIISLFTDDVNLYEVYNNGNWYDFGFVLGAGILFGGGSGGSRVARRRR